MYYIVTWAERWYRGFGSRHGTALFGCRACAVRHMHPSDDWDSYTLWESASGLAPEAVVGCEENNRSTVRYCRRGRRCPACQSAGADPILGLQPLVRALWAVGAPPAVCNGCAGAGSRIVTAWPDGEARGIERANIAACVAVANRILAGETGDDRARWIELVPTQGQPLLSALIVAADEGGRTSIDWPPSIVAEAPLVIEWQPSAQTFQSPPAHGEVTERGLQLWSNGQR